MSQHTISAIYGKGPIGPRGKPGPDGPAGEAGGNLVAALYLDGTASNGIFTPDNAAFTPSAAGTLDIRQALALDDWSPAVASVSMAQFGASGQYSWAIVQGTLGGFSLFHSTNGTALILANSTVPTRTDGALSGQRTLWDGSGTPDVSFYTKPIASQTADADLASDADWTLLNTTTVSGTVPSSLHNSTAALWLGADSQGLSPMIGKIVASRLLVDGVVQAAPDLRRPSGARLRDPTGRLWTLQGSAYAWAACPLA